jgi:hypothetical protein
MIVKHIDPTLALNIVIRTYVHAKILSVMIACPSLEAQMMIWDYGKKNQDYLFSASWECVDVRQLV